MNTNENTGSPALPTVLGARYVANDEAAAGYASVGFRLLQNAVRCHVPNDGGTEGAVFLWDERRAEWRIECGGLRGKALRAWNRYAKGAQR
jgi:hypothetical protein